MLPPLTLCPTKPLEFQVNLLNFHTDCKSPAVPLNSRLKQLSNEAGKFEASYECDAGYELFGSSTIKCTNETGWSKKLPFCGVNVALRKPANQSSSTRHGPPHYANNGHNINMVSIYMIIYHQDLY